MNKPKLVSAIKQVLNDNGIQPMIDKEALIAMDSIEFVSVIVDLERAFSIAIPDDLLPTHQTLSFNGIVQMIEGAIQRNA